MYMTYQGQTLQSESEWAPLTTTCGIETGVWPIPKQLDLTPTSVLETLAEALSELKTRRQYHTEDLVALSTDTPNLDNLLEPFAAPHYHTDDEVRICVLGSGIFTIYNTPDDFFDIVVEPEDFIVVPAYTMHSFRLTEEKQITAIRVFKENPRWEAVYEWPEVSHTP